MSTSLDTILSGGTPATETQETTQPVVETPQAEQTTEQQGEATEAEPSKDGKPIPVGAIRQAERDKADKRYTAVLDNLRQEIADRDAAWDRRLAKMAEAAKPPAQPQQAPDFYENPPAAVLHTVQPVVTELRNAMLHNSRLIAEQRHNEDVVKAADDAFAKAVGEGKLTSADPEFQQVMNSPNIYDAAVKWHRRILAQEEIGPDPAAYKAKLEAEIRAQLAAEAQPDAQTTQPRQNGAAPVMPSNFATARNVGARSGPAWSGPTPIADIFARPRK